MKKYLKSFILVFSLLAILIPLESKAGLGVGVGTGKIEFEKPLKPGGLYTFPSLTVINTGDEASEYGVSVEYKSDQPRMSPPKEWFSFSPETFFLEPGQSQVVEIKANIPVKTTPGDYFAYLEGHPIQKSTSSGGATIGIGAAAKLYFTVMPANFMQGLYYRVAFLMKNYSPWSYVFLSVLAMSFLVIIFKRFFSFNLGISVKQKRKK